MSYASPHGASYGVHQTLASSYSTAAHGGGATCANHDDDPCGPWCYVRATCALARESSHPGMQWAYCGAYDRLLCRDAVVFTHGGELPGQVAWELLESDATPGLSGHTISGNGYSGAQRVLLPVGEYTVHAKHVPQKADARTDAGPEEGGWDGLRALIEAHHAAATTLQRGARGKLGRKRARLRRKRQR